MNQADRKQLAAAQERLKSLFAAIEEERDTVRQLADDEREKFDNMPEGLQASERGQEIDEAANTLETMADHLDTAMEAVEEFNGCDIP